MHQKVGQVNFFRNQGFPPALLFTCILLIMGVVFGAILVNILGAGQRQDLLTYLQHFFLQFTQSNAVPVDIQDALMYKLRLIVVLWILGLSVIGFPLILAIVFMKGLAVGFTVGFLVNELALKGMLLAAASVLPQNLLMLPALLIASSSGLVLSISLLKQLFGKQCSLLKQDLFQYSGLMAMTGLVFALSAVVESWVSPALMQWVLPAIMQS